MGLPLRVLERSLWSLERVLDVGGPLLPQATTPIGAQVFCRQNRCGLSPSLYGRNCMNC
nr:MAG TPA: hypothetical protein [Caudoviricetes sp.]